jgi:hypothetical protein
MRWMLSALVLMALAQIAPIAFAAQSAPPAPSVTVPRLIHIAGVFQPVDGQPPAGVEVVTVSIYAGAEGGLPVWQERQSVAVERTTGRFTLLLGATDQAGIPAHVFASGEAQWMSLLFERLGEAEQPRVRIASVPYALKASDAETLGGLPASAYLRAPGGETTDAATTRAVASSATTSVEAPVMSDVVLPGTTNFLAKYVNGDDVGNSAVYETPTATVPSGAVGIGTTTPADVLHLRFNNPGGQITGLAVQNLGNTNASYSGMLFYDQNGALGQFQGFNNGTHEYRINNIARVTPGGAFNGSINFMTGSTSRFFVGSSGNIGIGTTAPSALLEVSNAVPGGPANMWMTSYTNFLGPYYFARRARGTPGAPTAVQSGDGLSGFFGTGHGTTGFGLSSGINIEAAQNWTDAAQGTALRFITTSINSNTPTTRMSLDATGNLGIGTATMPAAGILEVSNATHTASTANIVGSSFTGSGPGGTLFIGRKARGTSAAPTATLNGDNLVGFLAQGYATSAFSGTRGGMFVQASENWTSTAQGTRLNLNTTAAGTITPSTKVTIASNGDVGIGTMTPWTTVEAFRDGDVAVFGATSFGDGCCAGFVARLARGTAAAPAAVQLGDPLALFHGDGYGATDFSSEAGGIAILAAENFTDTAQGTVIGFTTTPLGSTEDEGRMAIMPDGNVGIGTFSSLPTIADKLQVFGDIRVGISGTDGCIKNFAGTGIAGTCSSDRRYKKDITPFGAVLNQLTALQPVHYFWRAADFPQQHFGDSRAYGLVAQDVENVLPELVVTGEDGFKAIDYTKLPLLTIQAVKELKAENEALKAGNEALKQRLDDLEGLLKEMLAKTAVR